MKLWKNTNTIDAYIPGLRESLCEASEAEVAVIGSKPIDLDRLPKLKALFKCGIGTDNVPFETCAERGIEVCLPSPQTAGIIYEETASFAAYLIMRMLYAKVGDLEQWRKFDREFSANRSVLLIGVGNIGKRVMAKISPMVSVLRYDEADPERQSLSSLLPRADVVSLHVPLTPETTGFMDGPKLALMKDSAALVNTARGPIVDEEALFAELSSGRLRAAFDVFWEEPYLGKLRDLCPDPFFMTPHVASTCRDFLEGLAQDFKGFTSEL